MMADDRSPKDLLKRFEGNNGQRLLIQALCSQTIVKGNESLAAALAGAAELYQFANGHQLIAQDGTDNDMYFILVGRVVVVVKGREVAFRDAGKQVGEMALVEPAARRCASVFALGDVVVAKVAEAKFTAIANSHPKTWRLLAVEAFQRLRQRNDLVTPPNPRPVLFLVSSTESLAVAQGIQAGLAHDDMLIRVWTDGVFLPSHYAMEDLLQQVRTSDFAAVVLGPDDKVISRHKAAVAPRDNLIGELFLFMGALGRERTLMVQPRGISLKLPTDLLGLNPITYQPGGRADLPALLGPVCTAIRSVVHRLGCK
jgi:CRP/FNR family cyclic AMP-dependent transcriptional regulator